MTARQTCENICRASGDLASIKDEEALNFIINKFTLSYYVWIGGEKKEGKWTWTDGTNFGYENWASNQPYYIPSNGYNHYSSNIYIMMTSGSSRSWYDRSNGYSYGALCQCDNSKSFLFMLKCIFSFIQVATKVTVAVVLQINVVKDMEIVTMTMIVKLVLFVEKTIVQEVPFLQMMIVANNKINDNCS